MSRRRPVLASLTGIALAVPMALTGTTAWAADGDRDGPGVALDRPGPALDRPAGRDDGERLSPDVVAASGEITAFVELATPSGLETVEAGGDSDDVVAAAEQTAALAEDLVADAAQARSAAPAPELVTVTTRLVAGAVVTGDAARVRELAASPSVERVRLLTMRVPANKGTDAFTRAVEAWQDLGLTGEGLRIGVIDTGLDYTHAAFGGPGTPEAYAEAYGTDGSGPVPEGLYDPEKFLGGWDFAGPTYHAQNNPVPAPDPNPIDAPADTPNSGHGTHVAGTAAGYGVLADGSTFRGDYAEADDLTDWLVGPGSAPRAGLYALKVFGDGGGGTYLTPEALDWAADPNGDGDFNDRLDVLNLSLGSDHSPADDPENDFIDHLTSLGTIVVSSAGNGTDVTDIGGSPGNARSALAVANSVGGTLTYDAVEVVEAADEGLEGQHAAQNSVDYAGTEDVTAPVSYLGAEVTGCTSLADRSDEVAGTIVYLYWDDDDTTRECGSAVRFDNAEAAGAVGVLLGSQVRVFTAGIAGNAGIPGAQLTAAATEALLPEIQAETLTVRLGPSLADVGFAADPSIADMVNSGSSRGLHGSLGVVKPDVAAPGTQIASAGAGWGDRPHTLSGTSMASPHVAGIAALVGEAHPDWAPWQIKAAIMNTATNDVYVEPDQSGPVVGPERVGTGRVDARAAVATDVLAWNSEDPEQVSVTFGVVPVGADVVTLRKTVTVRNLGSAAKTFTTSFAQATSAGGATITTRPASLTVAPGRTGLVTVELTVDPDTLEREIDPTSTPTYDLGVEVEREFVTTVAGRLVLTQDDGTEHRVPVHAAPRPTSDLAAQPVAFPGFAQTAPLTLTGRGVSRPGGWESIVAPFELVATSPQLEPQPGVATSESSLRASDVRWVGFSSTAPAIAAHDQQDVLGSGTIGIGIATNGEWATLGTNVVPVVETDVDGDGTWDFHSRVTKFDPELDFTVVDTYEIVPDEETGAPTLGGILETWPVNGLWASLETSVFDSDVVVLPISIDALGLAPGDQPTFRVRTLSPYAQGDSDLVDEVEPFTADPFAPRFWFDGGPAAADSLWFLGRPGEAVTVHRTGEPTGELLLLHALEPTGERAEVVPVTQGAAATTTTLEVTGELSEGATQELRAAVAPPEATGTVRFLDGETELGEVPLADGAATLEVTLDVGEHALSAVYVPDGPLFEASQSQVVTVEVTEVDDRVASRTTATAPSRAVAGLPVPVVALVQADERPTGKVRVSLGETVVGSGSVIAIGRTGIAVVATRPLPAGTHTLDVTYLGNDAVAPSSDQVTVRVVPLGRG